MLKSLSKQTGKIKGCLIAILVVIVLVAIIVFIGYKVILGNPITKAFLDTSIAIAKVQQEVNICIKDQGFEKISNCSSGLEASNVGGKGWNFNKQFDVDAKAMKNLYVENGKIIGQAEYQLEDNKTIELLFVYQPTKSGSDIKWDFDDDSTGVIIDGKFKTIKQISSNDEGSSEIPAIFKK